MLLQRQTIAIDERFKRPKLSNAIRHVSTKIHTWTLFDRCKHVEDRRHGILRSESEIEQVGKFESGLVNVNSFAGGSCECVKDATVFYDNVPGRSHTR
jgi:hypothetical protein